jgi:predicted ester cyclase
MSTEENKALARRFADDIINRGNVDVVVEVYAPDYVDHDPAMPEDVHGIEGAKENYNMILRAFPDPQVTIEDQVAEGDTVVSRWTMRATPALFSLQVFANSGGSLRLGSSIRYERVREARDSEKAVRRSTRRSGPRETR